MKSQEYIELILHGREERNLEYKGDVSWEDSAIKSSITKAILAMSNIKDGGVIVIGVHKKGESYETNGLSDQNFDSFKQDDVSSYVNEFADPFVEITLRQINYNEKKFIIIQIAEFSELPVICKKDSSKNLKRGGIYTRPRRKIESTVIPSQVEMRELIELAVDKGINLRRKKCKDVEYEPSEKIEINNTRFDEQLNGL